MLTPARFALPIIARSCSGVVVVTSMPSEK